MWLHEVCQLNSTSLFSGFVRDIWGATGTTVAQGGFKQPEAELANGTPNCPPLGWKAIVCGKNVGSNCGSCETKLNFTCCPANTVAS